MPSLFASVTQGAADAFAQATMATALQGFTNRAYRINQAEFELITPINAFPNIAAAALQDLEIGFGRRTKAAMPDIDDEDLIYKWAWRAGAPTSAGLQYPFPAINVWQPTADVLIVEDPIYWWVDSTATALTWSVKCRIDYELVEISEVDRLTLLTQSL